MRQDKELFSTRSDKLSHSCLIGVDLGATHVRVARVKGSDIVELKQEHIVKSGDPSHLLLQIEQLVKQVDNSDVQAIGIGVPSVVDVKKGIVYDVQNIESWDKVRIKEIFEKKFDKPVYINNDSNCFVLGEKYFGKGRGYETIVGITLGSGFGSGLILNNQLYYGANCGAGEVGMLPYKESIFEHYCSGMFFERKYGISGIQLFKNINNNDAKSLKIYKEFGKHLGIGIKAVLYAYDPQIIILGGSISEAFAYFKDAMFQEIRSFAYQRSLKALKIEQSKLDNAAVLGAAVLSVETPKSQ